jgi:hypothetical protein
LHGGVDFAFDRDAARRNKFYFASRRVSGAATNKIKAVVVENFFTKILRKIAPKMGNNFRFRSSHQSPTHEKSLEFFLNY